MFLLSLKDPYKLLDIPLLKRNVEKGLIDINYTELVDMEKMFALFFTLFQIEQTC